MARTMTGLTISGSGTDPTDRSMTPNWHARPSAFAQRTILPASDVAGRRGAEQLVQNPVAALGNGAGSHIPLREFRFQLLVDQQRGPHSPPQVADAVLA